MSRQEIEGISGWELVSKLAVGLPDDAYPALGKCESPIEQLFATALSLVALRVPTDERPSLDTQVSISKYRADIVLTGPRGAPRIVVECDGEAFHQDKAKDAQRTAEIERHGYRVMRFTGSEIHHNPVSLANSVLRQAGFVARNPSP